MAQDLLQGVGHYHYLGFCGVLIGLPPRSF